MKRKTFCTDGRGFQLTFDNGICLSTQFSRDHYCDNFGIPNSGDDDNECDNAEVAVFDNKGGNITELAEKDLFRIRSKLGIKTNVNIDDWYRLINWCKDQK